MCGQLNIDHMQTIKRLFKTIVGFRKAKDYVIFTKYCCVNVKHQIGFLNFAFEEIVCCIVVSLHIFFLLRIDNMSICIRHP